MTQPTNTNDNGAAIKKYAKIVLTIAGVFGLCAGLFNAITVYQVASALGGSGLGLAFQTVASFVFSFFVAGFVATVFCLVLTGFAVVLFALFGKRGGTGSGTPQQ